MTNEVCGILSWRRRNLWDLIKPHLHAHIILMSGTMHTEKPLDLIVAVFELLRAFANN